MDLEENIRKLREALAVNSAMTLKHEARLREHQEWLEANEHAWAKWREIAAQHAAMMIQLDQKLDRIADLILGGHRPDGGGQQSSS